MVLRIKDGHLGVSIWCYMLRIWIFYWLFRQRYVATRSPYQFCWACLSWSRWCEFVNVVGLYMFHSCINPKFIRVRHDITDWDIEVPFIGKLVRNNMFPKALFFRSRTILWVKRVPLFYVRVVFEPAALDIFVVFNFSKHHLIAMF